MSRRNLVVLSGFLMLFFVSLQLSSFANFRMRLASYFLKKYEYERALRIYDKILRKENAFSNLNKSDTRLISRVNFIEARIYDLKGMNCKAVKKYIDAIKADESVVVAEARRIKNLESYLNIGLAFLESGCFDRAIEFFGKSNAAGIDNRVIPSLVLITKEMKAKTPLLNSEGDFYLYLGNLYIKAKLWKISRDFFTNRILMYMQPVAVIDHLKRTYGQQGDIVEKIWGDNIYVTLEDFEGLDPKFLHWGIGTATARANKHIISGRVSYMSPASEYFDLEYSKAGNDYWAKEVDIPLPNTNLELGIRIFIKAQNAFAGNLTAHVSYPKQKTGSTWYIDSARKLRKGWEQRSIEGLYYGAFNNGIANGWDTDDIRISAIVINTNGMSNKFYIDDVQLYLVQ